MKEHARKLLSRVLAVALCLSMLPASALAAVQTEAGQAFTTKFEHTDKYLYRVGNQNAVRLDSLFKLTDDFETAKIANDFGDVTVTIENIAGNADGTYNANTKMIQFEGTGVVQVSIKMGTQNAGGQDYPLNLEVVDAVNATTATSATNNNVVLLNDVSGNFTVSGGHIVYGNGFKATIKTDQYSGDLASGFITLDNGTLDNIQVVCPVLPEAYLYVGQLPKEVLGKYSYNTKSAVVCNGNCSITNSYIFGGRAAVHCNSGSTSITNSMIDGGTVANILMSPSAASLTLTDVTTQQIPMSVAGSTKKVLGLGVLALVSEGSLPGDIYLKGTLKQHNWVSDSDLQYVPSAASSMVSLVMNKTEYLHTINGKNSFNSGFLFMNTDGKSISDPTDKIHDSRVDKDTIPYQRETVGSAYVYSYVNSGDTSQDMITVSPYSPQKNEIAAPNITVENLPETMTLTYAYDATVNKWRYSVTTEVINSFAFNSIIIKKGDTELPFSVKDSNGSEVALTQSIALDDTSTKSYTICFTDNVSYDNNGKVVIDNKNAKEYQYPFDLVSRVIRIEKPSVKSANYSDGICVASSYGGTWHGAAPALEGVTVRYYSSSQKGYVDLDLSSLTPSNVGKQNGTNNTWTYNGTDFTLTLTGGQVHSNNNVYAMPVVVKKETKNTLYFVASNTNGLVNSGNSARSVPVTYSFTANGEKVTFDHTWSIAEDKNAEYKYSDFVGGTLTKLKASSGGGSCVAEGTLITLADGTMAPVENLTGDELLLVWNLETGSYDTAPMVFIDSDPEAEYTIIHPYFDDGTDVEIISSHGFFDLDLGEYVYFYEDAAQYIGHSFVKDNGDGTWSTAKLTDVEIETKTTTPYSPVTFKHLCYYVNGMLSMPGGISGLFNIYDVDTETMAYDPAKKEADVAEYGLLTLDDYGAMIPEIVFEAFNGDDLGVAIGKGLLTWDDIEYLANRYVPLVEISETPATPDAEEPAPAPAEDAGNEEPVETSAPVETPENPDEEEPASAPVEDAKHEDPVDPAAPAEGGETEGE